MPITLNCPKCHKPFRVRDESIGGRVRCPSCGSVLQVPSALSPASHFDEPPKTDLAPPDTGGGRPLAEAVPPSSHPGTGLPVAPGRREDMVDLGPPPGAPLPGPPSIKAPIPQAPTRPFPFGPVADRPSVPSPLPPTPRPAGPRPGFQLSAGDPTAWGPVHRGLGMIRLAMFLCAFVFLAAMAHGAWIGLHPDSALKDGPGMLGKEDWPLRREVAAAYTAIPIGLAVLLLLIGRLRCVAAPPEAHARGLALGATFFTLLGITGLGLFFGMTYFDLGAKLKLPPEARLTGLYAAVPAAFLSDVLTLLYIGQVGWPLGRPQLQRSVAGLVTYAAVLPAAILIGMMYYPVPPGTWEKIQTTWNPLDGGIDNDDTRRVLIWCVALLAGSALFFLRYAGVCGQARRAIRRVVYGEG